MRIAVAQMPGASLDRWAETLALLEALVTQAAERGAQLVVLPECAWPAYCLGSIAEYRAARNAGLPAPATFLARLQQLARNQHIALCAGFVAEDHDRLYNAAAFVAANGTLLGMRHKCFLWAFDRNYFSPGTRIEPLDTDFGRIGLMICADARLPEIAATLAARGAELILQPTAWVNAGATDALWNPQPDFLIAARATEFGVPIASASKWGRERDTTFVGSSLICAADGTIRAQCGSAETTVAVAEVTPAPPRRPVITPAERGTLLSPAPPDPPRGDVRPVRVWPVAHTINDHAVAAQLDTRAPVPEHVLVLRDGPSSDPVRGDRYTLLSGPTPAPLDIAGVRIGSVRAPAAARFAPLRCLALRGVHAVVVFGADCPRCALQARACENRIFVVQVTAAHGQIIDPHGHVVPATDAPVTLAAALAARKTVAPGTDVLAGRCPAQYEF